MLPPSVNNLFINVGRRRRRSPKYTEWQTEAGLLARSQVKSKRIQGPFAVYFYFVRPDKKRRDIDNLQKAILDLVSSLGFIDDDSECQSIHCTWAPHGPATLVQILPCNRRG